jgi:hypothetical protein
MLKEVYYLVNHYTAFCYKVIYKSDYFLIDYWSFLHVFNGLWVVFVSYYKRYRHPFLILGLALFSWEFLEISFIYLSAHIFKPETIPDQFTDIIVGFIGGLLGWLLWGYKEKTSC